MKLARHAIADNEAGPVTRPLAVFDCSSNNTAPTGAVTFSERECTIELEGRNSNLRIHWKGATAVDVESVPFRSPRHSRAGPEVGS